jgi:Domain of unknown function (DUF397)
VPTLWHGPGGTGRPGLEEDVTTDKRQAIRAGLAIFDRVRLDALSGPVLVRDTTNRDGGTLTFSAKAWQTFVNGIK